MKLGIIGLPGAGRATLFQALTGTAPGLPGSSPENRVAAIRVPDSRVDTLSRLYQPKKTVFAQVEYFLPAMRAASKESRKNETTWSEARTTDALIHVLRNFPVPGVADPSPAADLRELTAEMVFADLLVVEKRLERLEMDAKRGRRADPEELRLLAEAKALLEAETPLRSRPDLAASPLLRGYALLSAKPCLVLVNNGDEDDTLPDLALAPELDCLAVRGKLEGELARMAPEEAAEFMAAFGVATSAMDRVIAASYRLLGLASFFTVGPDEVRAWTIRQGTPALDAAEVIHSDIKKGFIRAEVVAYDDLLAAGSYAEARKKGTVRLEGKTYPVADGDIIEFRFSV
ncbi:MAG: DUF933 domain-containing protein [Thermodesulfobacteriota bacterium]